jgi:hypothetical protein
MTVSIDELRWQFNNTTTHPEVDFPMTWELRKGNFASSGPVLATGTFNRSDLARGYAVHSFPCVLDFEDSTQYLLTLTPPDTYDVLAGTPGVLVGVPMLAYTSWYGGSADDYDFDNNHPFTGWAGSTNPRMFDVQFLKSSEFIFGSVTREYIDQAAPVVANLGDSSQRFSAKLGLVFTTPVGPPTLSNPTPAHEATGIASSLTELSWEFSGDATSFDVYFGESGSEELVAEGVETTAWSVPAALTHNSVYGWRVVAHTTGETITGPTWTFTTMTLNPPIPTAENAMITKRRLIAAADDKIWYEDI